MSVIQDFLLLIALPYLAGQCGGLADDKRSRAQIFDSLLRHSHRVGDWRPEVMRRTFTSIVNGKTPLLDPEGSELPRWKSKAQRVLLFTMVTMFLVTAIVIYNSGGSKGSYKEWALVTPVAPAFFLLYFSGRLAGKTHRTSLSTKNGDRWIRSAITAERDEEGLPTRNVTVDGKRVGAGVAS